MERDDIIRMAREAGFICLFPDEAVNGIGTIYNYNSGDEEITEMMERFAALVAAEKDKQIYAICELALRTGVTTEREACARVCENIENYDETIDDIYYSDHYAKAIRARGEK